MLVLIFQDSTDDYNYDAMKPTAGTKKSNYKPAPPYFLDGCFLA